MGRAILRHRRSALLALSLLVGLVCGLGDWGRSLDQALTDTSAGLRQRPASGEVHIVEIDARSIAAIDRWPWPRANYAAVVDRLRQAGAAGIAFDVDFSSRSNPRDDAALAAALARAAGGVILPTFGQAADGARGGWVDSLPIPELRGQAALGAVSILPDADGVVRRAPLGVMTAGVPRPSLSALLGQLPDGAADRDFAIDFAIDPASIPRHSFIDIRDGHFDPASLAGKQVLIGATAIEMGDRYAVPRHGVIPGVVIQALAAETLRAGLPHDGGWLWPLVAAGIAAAAIVRLRDGRVLLAGLALGPAGLFAANLASTVHLHRQFALAPALAALGTAVLGTYLGLSAAAARRRRALDPASGLPNRLALREAGSGDWGAGLLVARFVDYDKLIAALDAAAAVDLIRRVHDRLALVAGPDQVHRVEDRALGWVCASSAGLEEQLAALRALMLAPVEVAGRRVDVILAFGFAERHDGEGTDPVLARALLAADQAAQSGAAWLAHDEAGDEQLARELSLLGELDEAIAAGDIDVVYQPKIDLRHNRVASVEALVRWNHRTLGRLTPDAFIPLAERSGRIAGLTLHILERTIATLQQWHAAGLELTAAVNLSAKLLDRAEFGEAVRACLARSGIPPQWLIFEVTETAALTDIEAAARSLQAMRNLGIAISIDDYGTGQSTLSYLRQLPLDELKLDRRFVAQVHRNRDDAVLVQSTIHLAHELGLRVVAEGVEVAECLGFLRDAGCDLAQGYLFSPAVPAAAITLLAAAPLALAA